MVKKKKHDCLVPVGYPVRYIIVIRQSKRQIFTDMGCPAWVWYGPVMPRAMFTHISTNILLYKYIYVCVCIYNNII